MRRPTMPTMAGHQRKNLAAARVIVADPQKFGGPGSLPVQWAERVLAAAGQQSGQLRLPAMEDVRERR